MSGVYVSQTLIELGFTGTPGMQASQTLLEVGFLTVDPGHISIHATQLSTGSSWNVDLDAERMHMERDEFLALDDTPALFSGSAGKTVIVNDDEDALTFGALKETFLDLDDTPSAYVGHATKFVRVNTGSSGLEFSSAPGGGAGSIGVLVHDEGVFLGTGTIINVVGDNISMSLSGSVAKIEQDNLSVYQDSVLITGASDVSFDENMEVVATGSVTFVTQRARYCIARSLATQSIANQGAVVTFHGVASGEDDWFSSGTNPTRVTVPITGLYALNGGFEYETPTLDMWLAYGGSGVEGLFGAYPRFDGQGTNYHPGLADTRIVKIDKDGYVTLTAGHDSGAARNIASGARLGVALIGTL